MRTRWLAILLVVGVATPCRAAEQPAPAPAGSVVKGLAVHEWGVFRVHNDLALANADMRAIWDSLPKFVYGQLDGRELPKHWANIEIRDRPVIFFHAPTAVEVQLKVDFPGGMPGVWWPGTQSPSVRTDVAPAAGPAKTKALTALEWRLSLKEPPKNFKRALGLPAVDGSHWMQTLRNVAADDVFAHVGERNFGYEREKFVYYDGLFPAGSWVDISFARGQVAVTSRVKHPVFDLTVVDRTAGKVRVARLARLGGEVVQPLEFNETGPERWPAAGVTTLIEQLQAAGLNAAEARALVELWKQELFLTEGVTLFYRLPQEVYDRLLPLSLTPRADQTVRVGLVQHAHCEPDLAQRVDRLIKDLDSGDFATRQQAQRRLEEMGRAGYVQLVRYLQRNPPLEVRRRVEDLLRKYDATQALPKPSE